MMVALIVDANASEGDLSGENPLSFGFFGVLLGSMPIITLGVLTTASEYGTGMIRTTMVACPSRGRVLAAKGIVFFAIAFVVTLVSTGFVAMVDAAMFTDAREPSGGEWIKATLGVSLYIALLGLLSLAVGSIIRHSASAITIMIGLLLAPLVIAIFMFSESLEKLREALFEYSIPSQLGVWYSTQLGETGPSGWDPLWIALGVTAAAFMRRLRPAGEAGRVTAAQPQKRGALQDRCTPGCGGPARSSRPCASAGGRRRPRARARRRHAAPRPGSSGRSRGTGSSCPARSPRPHAARSTPRPASSPRTASRRTGWRGRRRRPARTNRTSLTSRHPWVGCDAGTRNTSRGYTGSRVSVQPTRRGRGYPEGTDPHKSPCPGPHSADNRQISPPGRVLGTCQTVMPGGGAPCRSQGSRKVHARW